MPQTKDRRLHRCQMTDKRDGLPCVLYSRPLHSLRFAGETDDAFRQRAQRACRLARVLVDACLANRCMQELIADPAFPYTLESVRTSPTVRIEYEQAIAIGGIGETLQATRSKHWGEGPHVMPLHPDDEFFPDRITYRYRPNSLYNRRYEQRMRLKQLLGKRYRKLVGEAKYHTKTIFLKHLADDQAKMIRRVLNVDPGTFWRAAKGKVFLDLPKRAEQLEFDFGK